jgi:cell division protein FtsQ
LAPRVLTVAGFLAGLSLACVGAYEGLIRSPWLAARQVSVIGAEWLSADAVRRQADLRRGQNILGTNLARAEKRLRSHPRVAEARVTPVFPPGFRIRIREHRPLAVFELGEGFLVDEAGRPFKRLEDGDPAGLPVVFGLRASDLPRPGEAPSDPFQAAMDVLELGRRPASVLPNRRIRRIRVDRELGLALLLAPDERLAGAREIKLGYGDYPAKYERLRTFLRFALEAGHPAGHPSEPKPRRLRSIDLNIPDRVVVDPDPPEAIVGDGKEV